MAILFTIKVKGDLTYVQHNGHLENDIYLESTKNYLIKLRRLNVNGNHTTNRWQSYNCSVESPKKKT